MPGLIVSGGIRSGRPGVLPDQLVAGAGATYREAVTKGELARRVLVALVTGAATVAALVAYGTGGEGTVVAKNRDAYDYACQAGGTVTGPVAVPAWGACSDPTCWRLVVRDSAGDISEPCVSRDEYDRAQVGEFWHGRTDR
jgi:hypothetical protein